MLARASRRLLPEASWPSFLPPAFLLPTQTRAWLTTVSHSMDSDSVPEPLLSSTQHRSTEAPNINADALGRLDDTISITLPTRTIVTTGPRVNTRKAPTSSKNHSHPLALSHNLRSMLPLLQAQQSHYAALQLHGKSYLVTQGDMVRLPFLMPDVNPGDTLRLDCATMIGSRDFTLKAGPLAQKGLQGLGAPINNSETNVSMTDAQRARLDSKKRVKLGYLDDRLFVCRAVVTGVESEPLRVTEKKKQRNRHTRHVYSKHRYTCLRISELRLKSIIELEEEGATSSQAAISEDGAVVETTLSDAT